MAMETTVHQIKEFRTQVEEPLHRLDRVQDYCAYAAEVKNIIISIFDNENPAQQFFLQSLEQFQSIVNPELLKNGTAHDHICDVAVIATQQLLNNLDTQHQIPHVLQIPIGQSAREAVKQYGIVQPTKDTHLYR